MDDKFDELLMTVAAQSGGVEGLLKTFFGFLNRRTDFYALIPDNVTEPKMGFRPGAAEALLVRCFRSFPYRDFDGNIVADPRKLMPKGPLAPPRVPRKEPKEPAPASDGEEKQGQERKQAEGEVRTEAKSEEPEKAENPGSTAPPKPRVVKREELPSLKLNDEGKQIPLGNGGVGENYHWQQSLHELTIYFQFPEGTKMSDIDCKIRSTRISVGLKGEKPILAGIFPEQFKVKSSESFWSFEAETSVLTVSLDKTQETWWDSVIEGEPEIDTQQVDSTRAVEDYDEETQATIRKIMFDQDQKRKGLPTSDEMKKYEILEKCKDLPGSPFLMENLDQNVPRPLPEDEIE